jgi:4-amino-4-deoxy-L-arabinose transferase-like glycosyltransferase
MEKHSPTDQSHIDDALGRNTNAGVDLVVLILILGFLVRLFACLNTAIINPDGTLYIHKARALFYGQPEQAQSCGPSYFSVYPILIAWAYRILHNWVAAARSVSLFFGSLTLIPVYLLVRRFSASLVSAMCVLVFALIPTLVDSSADAVKDPIAWFFVGFGLYLFVLQLEKDGWVYLFLSSVCYLVASLARVDSILCLIVSCLYILFGRQQRKMQKILCFLAPVLIAVLLGIPAAKAMGINVMNAFRISEAIAKITAFVGSYSTLRATLASLIEQHQSGTLPFFLEKVRQLVLFIDLGTLLKYLLDSLFYPFFLLFLLGLARLREGLKSDRRIRYLAVLSCFSLVLLYFHLLETWITETRFFVVFMLSTAIFMAFGIEKSARFIHDRFHISTRSAFSILCLLILAFGLAKDLKQREEGKLVFKQIGELIARREGNRRVIGIFAFEPCIAWVSFYANLDYKGAPCPLGKGDPEKMVGKSAEEFVRNLKKAGIRYFLWEERPWQYRPFHVLDEMSSYHFEEIGYWTQADSGRLILFQVGPDG